MEDEILKTDINEEVKEEAIDKKPDYVLSTFKIIYWILGLLPAFLNFKTLLCFMFEFNDKCTNSIYNSFSLVFVLPILAIITLSLFVVILCSTKKKSRVVISLIFIIAINLLPYFLLMYLSTY